MDTQSPPNSKVIAAFVKAQAAMTAASKSSVNPHFNSKFADLSDVMDAAKKPLADNGLAVSQELINANDGVSVTTKLFHESGECLASPPFTLPVAQKTPQGYGSACTYARRYSLAAFLGIVAEEDDDGNAASGTGKASAPPPPNGTSALKNKVKGEPPPETTGVPATHDRGLSFRFGGAKDTPIHALTEKDLRWYRKTFAENVADESKKQWAAANTLALANIDAEIKFRGLA